MAPSVPPALASADDELVREAETALRNLGFLRASSGAPRPTLPPAFWVHGPRSRRRSIPVYVDRTGTVLSPMILPADAAPDRETDRPPSILVVSTDAAAESAWGRVPQAAGRPTPPALQILVLRDAHGTGRSPHWHLSVVSPREVLRLATGIVVGMYRRAFSGSGAGDVDFGALLVTLRQEYHLDVQRSLGVSRDEEALFVLYHLALRDTFAPGNIAGNLHSIVANPTGPASRIPWFAG
jgi:hypothetical protein